MLNNYKFIKSIGKGGFGEVFLAQEIISGRNVAIKRLSEQNSSHQDLILHEIETVAKLSHPNIISYFHSFRHDNKLYLVMEYCEGGSLRDKILAQDIPYNIALKYCEIISNTLEFVHNQGIVHHDIKPSNILFDSNDNLKITDFGVANTLGGTGPYIAPEMFDWNFVNELDRRIDVYALGITLYEMIKGFNPFSNLSHTEILSKHEEMKLDFSDIPSWVCQLILKAIHIIPELRFQFMRDFKDAITAQNVPVIFSKDIIDAANLAIKAQRALKRKRWKNIFKELEYADENTYQNNVNIKIQLGNYHLFFHNLDKAKYYFEEAKRLNSRINIHKELAGVYLEYADFSSAISLLSDYIYLNPSDLEAHNMLIKCYYETQRYEIAIDHLERLIGSKNVISCFHNNLFISEILLNPNSLPDQILKDQQKNPFLVYNHKVISEKDSSWSHDGFPSLKSKLIYQDFRFNTIQYFNNIIEVVFDGEKLHFNSNIVSFGRAGYNNDFPISDSTEISRRHFVIINFRNDVWLYNLSNIPVYVDEEKVINKKFLNGLHVIKVSSFEIIIRTNLKSII